MGMTGTPRVEFGQEIWQTCLVWCGLGWVGLGIFFPYPPSQKEAKGREESQAVRSCKKGIWLPEIKNKAGEKGAIGGRAQLRTHEGAC